MLNRWQQNSLLGLLGALAFVWIGLITTAPRLVNDQVYNPQVTETETASEKGSPSATIEKHVESDAWWLDFWTVGLLIVAGTQAYFFLSQLHLIRAGMADTKAAAEAAIAGANAAAKSAGLAEKALLDYERPWVFINLHPANTIDVTDSDHATISVKFDIANYGRVPATIEEFCGGLTIEDRPRRPIRRDDYNQVLGPNETLKDQTFGLEIGGRTFTRTIDADGGLHSVTPEMTSPDNLIVYVSIIYKGLSDITLESVFGWYWDTMIKSWRRIPDKAYNYRT